MSKQSKDNKNTWMYFALKAFNFELNILINMSGSDLLLFVSKFMKSKR
jgi:hypothetical protein